MARFVAVSCSLKTALPSPLTIKSVVETGLLKSLRLLPAITIVGVVTLLLKLLFPPVIVSLLAAKSLLKLICPPEILASPVRL